VSSPVFTVGPFGTQTVTVTVNTAGQPADGSYRFGTLTLTSTGSDSSTRSPALRLPIAVAVRNPELGLSTETIAISAPANTTRSANFTLWSNSNPVDFTTRTTGTGTGAVVAQSSVGAQSGYATGRYTDRTSGVYAADDFVVTQTTSITGMANEGFVLGTGVISAAEILSSRSKPPDRAAARNSMSRTNTGQKARPSASSVRRRCVAATLAAICVRPPS
jgi:hypothetical protein